MSEQSSGSEVTSGEGGYVPPATQEELNRIIEDRVARAKKSVAEEVRGEFKEFVPKSRVDELQGSLDAATRQLGVEWRSSAVREAGLPDSLAGRLQGDSREAIFADARSLADAFAGRAPMDSVSTVAEGEPEPVVESVAVPRRTPSEKRGFAGGHPGNVQELSVEDVLKKVNRF